MKSIAGLPDDVMGLLTAADARKDFPPGTMASIMMQEVGGQLDKFLGDPTTYHYAPDARGIRRTKDGTVSTAFGPFGILDSTAREPGWGVQPLSEKQSLEEQVRFASDYLAARVKQTGSFEEGLASYGQGKQYASAVLGRIPGYPQPEASPTMMAQAPVKKPIPITQTTPATPLATDTPIGPVPQEDWERLRQVQQTQAAQAPIPSRIQQQISRFGNTQIAAPQFDPGLLQSLLALGSHSR